MLVIGENAWCEFIEVQRKSRLLLYLVLNGELLLILHYYNLFPFYLTSSTSICKIILPPGNFLPLMQKVLVFYLCQYQYLDFTIVILVRY